MDAVCQDRSILRDTWGTWRGRGCPPSVPVRPWIRPDGCDLLQPAACVHCAAVHLKQEVQSQNLCSWLQILPGSGGFAADADQQNGWSAIKNELSEEQTVLKSKRQKQTCEILTCSVYPSTLKVKGFVFY